MAFNIVVAVAYLAARGKMVGFHLEDTTSNADDDEDLDWWRVSLAQCINLQASQNNQAVFGAVR